MSISSMRTKIAAKHLGGMLTGEFTPIPEDQSQEWREDEDRKIFATHEEFCEVLTRQSNPSPELSELNNIYVFLELNPECA